MIEERDDEALVEELVAVDGGERAEVGLRQEKGRQVLGVLDDVREGLRRVELQEVARVGDEVVVSGRQREQGGGAGAVVLEGLEERGGEGVLEGEEDVLLPRLDGEVADGGVLRGGGGARHAAGGGARVDEGGEGEGVGVRGLLLADPAVVVEVEGGVEGLGAGLEAPPGGDVAPQQQGVAGIEGGWGRWVGGAVLVVVRERRAGVVSQANRGRGGRERRGRRGRRGGELGEDGVAVLDEEGGERVV